ncbi:MAG: phosphoribosylglycinamide formyltransferase [Bacteroidales bacterium]
MIELAVFVSGGGTNCENIIRYFSGSDRVHVALVIANKPGIPALEKADRLGVPTRVLPKADLNREDVLLPLMREYSIDFIVLAGFLLVIPDFLIREYDHRMINLHPALLPKFGGMGMYGHHVHEAVKASGEAETGMTVHWVSGKVDGGEIIAQFRTSISPDDTPDDIAAKEHVLEMEHFPQVIEKVLATVFPL